MNYLDWIRWRWDYDRFSFPMDDWLLLTDQQCDFLLDGEKGPLPRYVPTNVERLALDRLALSGCLPGLRTRMFRLAAVSGLLVRQGSVWSWDASLYSQASLLDTYVTI